MVMLARPFTVADFEALVDLPENTDKQFEFVGGEVIEVPSNVYSSHLATRIIRRLAAYVEDHDLGFVTTESGGYQIGDDRYAPDVAFISKNRQAELPTEGYNPLPPDLAVEVVSPSDRERDLRIKIANYVAVGTTVWVVYPAEQTVEIYIPHQTVQILGLEDVLVAGGDLAGFELPIKQIFPPSN